MLQVKEKPELLRDEYSSAIINNSDEQYKLFLKRKNNNFENRLNNLEEKIEKILNLLENK